MKIRPVGTEFLSGGPTNRQTWRS